MYVSFCALAAHRFVAHLMLGVLLCARVVFVAATLLIDLKKEVSTAYNVLTDDGIALRGLFIIDREGVIQHSTINNLAFGRSVDETLRVLQAIQHIQANPDVRCSLPASLALVAHSDSASSFTDSFIHSFTHSLTPTWSPYFSGGLPCWMDPG